VERRQGEDWGENGKMIENMDNGILTIANYAQAHTLRRLTRYSESRNSITYVNYMFIHKYLQ
jgi:hypothetical protein